MYKVITILFYYLHRNKIILMEISQHNPRKRINNHKEVLHDTNTPSSKLQFSSNEDNTNTFLTSILDQAKKVDSPNFSPIQRKNKNFKSMVKINIDRVLSLPKIRNSGIQIQQRLIV